MSAIVVGLLVLAWAATITMLQLDRLIGEVVGDNRSVFSLTDATGFTPWVACAAWPTWASDAAGEALDFIAMYTAADFVFIACYAALLLVFVRRLTHSSEKRARVFYTTLVCIVIAFDVVENSIILYLTSEASELPDGALGALAVAQAVATGGKWAATLVFGAFAVLGNVLGVRVRSFIVAAAAGLYAQRLGLLVVGGFSYLALSGAGDLAEQVPDVYRGWLDILHPDDKLGHGFWHAAAATAAGLVVLVCLIYFGRQRGRRYFLGEPPAEPPALLRAWLVTAVVFALLAWWVGTVEWWTFGALIVTLLSVGGVSWGIRQRFPQIHTVRPLLGRAVAKHAPAAFAAGDTLAVVWIAAGFLAPFAAMVPVLALASRGEYAGTKFDGGRLIAVVAISTTVLALAVLIPALAWRLLRSRWAPLGPVRRDDPNVASPGELRVLSRASAPTQQGSPESAPAPETAVEGAPGILSAALVLTTPKSPKPRTLLVMECAFIAASVLIVVWIAIHPTDAGRSLGPLAMVLLLLGAWTGIAGALVLILGERRPPELFILLRLRSTPIVLLTLVLPILIASLVPAAAPHAIRLSEDLRMPPHRPTIASAFTHWSGTACVYEGPDGVAIQPMILVAAEGGGIRATTWTVDVLRELFAPESDCAAEAVFASSGASGGSVGLAMFATSTAESKDKVHVSRASGPDALGANVAGLLSAEWITALTGLRPAITVGSDSFPRDRADLHERVWEEDPAHELGAPFDSVARPGTGHIVFNSTDAVSNCKVVISQLDLSRRSDAPTDTVGGAPQCAGPDTTLAHAVDLIDVLGAEECPAGMTWATASFLSARFPFVSPSGRLDQAELPTECEPPWDMQLLDGGLLDNSGLGTVSDMLPELLTEIRSQNTSRTAGSASKPIVVPIVLWVSNGPGSDVLAANGRARPEWVAPVATLMSVKAAQLEPSAWLSRLTDQLGTSAICGTTRAGCVKSVNAVRALVPTGVVVASQATEPATSVPLGWTLSWFSRSRLAGAANAQANCASATADGPAACRASGDYSPLGALLGVFTSRPQLGD